MFVGVFCFLVYSISQTYGIYTAPGLFAAGIDEGGCQFYFISEDKEGMQMSIVSCHPGYSSPYCDVYVSGFIYVFCHYCQC
jgi:hypothetical protein